MMRIFHTGIRGDNYKYVFLTCISSCLILLFYLQISVEITRYIFLLRGGNY